MVTAYTAIMRAADQIENNPHTFHFSSMMVPSSKNCGTPGCALGWIAHFAGFTEAYGYQKGARVLTKDPQTYVDEHVYTFYERMDILSGQEPLPWGRRLVSKKETALGWYGNPKLCAVTLRKYAEKYHGHEKPKVIMLPASVEALFREQFEREEV